MEKLQRVINTMSDDEISEVLKERKQYLKDETAPVIMLNKETSYRCIEYYDKVTGKEYFLQYKWWEEDEWTEVSDLSELKIWEYNELADKLNKHYPDYPIERLDGRFV